MPKLCEHGHRPRVRDVRLHSTVKGSVLSYAFLNIFGRSFGVAKHSFGLFMKTPLPLPQFCRIGIQADAWVWATFDTLN